MKLLSLMLGMFCAVSLTAQIVYSDNEWQTGRITFASDNSRVIPEPTVQSG